MTKNVVVIEGEDASPEAVRPVVALIDSLRPEDVCEPYSRRSAARYYSSRLVRPRRSGSGMGARTDVREAGFFALSFFARFFSLRPLSLLATVSLLELSS